MLGVGVVDVVGIWFSVLSSIHNYLQYWGIRQSSSDLPHTATLPYIRRSEARTGSLQFLYSSIKPGPRVDSPAMFQPRKASRSLG